MPVEGLLERRAALAQLAGLAGRAARGGGGVVLLRGEAGVGKTALIGRFVGGLDGGAQVLRGWCDPLTAPRTLGPLIDMLAALDDQRAQSVRAAIYAGDSEAIYARLLGLVGDGGWWVWVIEDVHWADGATLDLLRFVVRRVDSLRLLLVVSYRDDEIGPQHPLAVALGDVASCAGVNRIRLDRLSLTAVAKLAAGSGVNADALHRLTGGNPFYVTEVLAAGPDALAGDVLPRSVAEAVWGRLARLSTSARDTAYAVAVCGPRANPAVVQKVCPSAATAIDECMLSGVLVADGPTVAFRHELARRATLDQIPDPRRTLLHKRALAALAEAPIDPDTLGALVFHADRVGDYDAVISYGPAAAERAARLGANSQAAELYALVLRHADTTPAGQRVVWLEQHALASYLCGLGEPAVSSWWEAIRLRHALGDTLAESEDLRWLSHEMWGMGRSSEAADAGMASLRLVQDAGPCAQLAWSLVNMAEQGAWGFDPAAASYAARAIAVGAQLGDHAAVIQARGCAAMVRVLCTDTGWNELEAAWHDAMAIDANGEHASLLGICICGFAALHYDLDAADRYLTDAAGYCRDRDLFTFEACNLSVAAMVGLHRGHWAHARSCAEEVLTRPGLVQVSRILARLTLTMIHARRGEQPDTPLFDDIAASSNSDQMRLFPIWAARAEAAWLAGDDDTARSEAQSALATIGDRGDPWLIWQLRRWDQLPGNASAPIAVDNPITPFHLEVSGDWRAAADAWMRRGCPYDAAIAQLGGDISAVESALATFRKLGARPAARRARQRLAALRGRTHYTRRADTLADPDGLTRREREVLELLAGRRSDAEIAAALHISRKTAGCHVSAILAKLGVDNRIQAAAYALQRQAASRA